MPTTPATSSWPVEIVSPAGVTIKTMSKKLLQEQFKGFEGGDAYGAKGGEVVARSLLQELSRVEKLLLSQVEPSKALMANWRSSSAETDARGLFSARPADEHGRELRGNASRFAASTFRSRRPRS